MPKGGLFVSNYSYVMVYAPEADGDASPIRMISGSGTRLSEPAGLALDIWDRLYVANATANRVTGYAAGTEGNVVPFFEMSGADAGLNTPYGLAVGGGGELYVANFHANSVTVYARGAVVQSGGGGFGKSPIRTIRGAITDLSVPQGLALDGEGLLYVANRLGSTVTVYDARANGNTAPIRKISGENTGLGNPRGLALDGAGSLYVANHSVNGTVTVYAAGANGNVAPIRTISGPSTGLGAGASTGLPGPGGLAVDGAGTLYVADLAANSVMVYAPGANGNVAPIRTIRGANTRLNRPVMLLLRP